LMTGTICSDPWRLVTDQPGLDRNGSRWKIVG
jgi:hypothetical protein